MGMKCKKSECTSFPLFDTCEKKKRSSKINGLRLIRRNARNEASGAARMQAKQERLSR